MFSTTCIIVNTSLRLQSLYCPERKGASSYSLCDSFQILSEIGTATQAILDKGVSRYH